MRHKKLIIIFVIIALLIAGGFFLGKQKSPPAVQQTSLPDGNTVPTSNSGGKIEVVAGTIKSLQIRGRTEKCTFSYNTEDSTVTGQVYAANGKIREEFQSTSVAGPINGHMIIDSVDAYLWTDQKGPGIKFPIAGQPPTSAAKNDKTPDINKEMRFDCLPWTAENSMFAIPTDITFQNM